MTSKVDIIKNLANKLNLIDNNDLKGGESNDLDSLIELAIEADLVSQSSYQDGGGGNLRANALQIGYSNTNLTSENYIGIANSGAANINPSKVVTSA